MQANPGKEHEWLHEMVGEWATEMTCAMGPGQPPQTTPGRERVRSLGGLWTLGEGRSEMPDGTPMTTLMTLGFDPAKGRFVGSFTASMMTHLWLYEGSLDETGTVLTLETSGPSMTGDGTIVPYRDIMTIKSPDHRILTSSAPGADGVWVAFMTAHHPHGVSRFLPLSNPGRTR